MTNIWHKTIDRSFFSDATALVKQIEDLRESNNTRQRVLAGDLVTEGKNPYEIYVYIKTIDFDYCLIKNVKTGVLKIVDEETVNPLVSRMTMIMGEHANKPASEGLVVFPCQIELDHILRGINLSIAYSHPSKGNEDVILHEILHPSFHLYPNSTFGNVEDEDKDDFEKNKDRFGRKFIQSENVWIAHRARRDGTIEFSSPEFIGPFNKVLFKDPGSESSLPQFELPSKMQLPGLPQDFQKYVVPLRRDYDQSSSFHEDYYQLPGLPKNVKLSRNHDLFLSFPQPPRPPFMSPIFSKPEKVFEQKPMISYPKGFEDLLNQTLQTMMPGFEKLYQYVQMIKPPLEQYEDSNDDLEKLLQCEEFKAPAPLTLPEHLQFYLKVVDIEMKPNSVHTGGLHVEGLAEEHIIATGIYYMNCPLDSSILFKRNYTEDEANYLLGFMSQDISHLFRSDLEGTHCSVGELQIDGSQSQIVMFPNSHIHKVQPIFNHTKETVHRQLIVFFLVDPEYQVPDWSTVDLKQVISTRDNHQALTDNMSDRMRSKDTLEPLDINFCEH
jgi:hypothetical protein